MLFRSPDSSRLASVSKDGTVGLWDAGTGVFNATLEVHFDHVEFLLFSPDSSRLAAGLGDNKARLWDCATGDPIATLEGHLGSSSSFSFYGSRLGSRFGRGVTSWHDNICDYLYPFNAADWNAFPPLPRMSLHRSKDTFRRYYIRGTLLNSNDNVPLLWLPADTPDVLCEAFCRKAAAFGCEDGRVILLDLSLDLSQLDLQEIDIGWDDISFSYTKGLCQCCREGSLGCSVII